MCDLHADRVAGVHGICCPIRRNEIWAITWRIRSVWQRDSRAKASQSAEFFLLFFILFVPCAKAFTQRLRRWWLSWSATVITATWHQSDNIRNKKKKYKIIIGRNKELGQLAQLASYLVGPVAVLLANASCVSGCSNVAYAYYLLQVQKWQHE